MLALVAYILFQFYVPFVNSINKFNPKSSVIVFGDSNFEAGRKSSDHASWMKAGYSPYGSECMFVGQFRFSNGEIIPEIIAYQLKTSVTSIDELRHDEYWSGANFASASAGILPETGTVLGKNLCFKDQIRVFKEYAQTSLKEQYNANELSYYLLNSIYLINMGTSDYLFNFLQTEYYNTSKRYNGEEFAKHLIEKYSNHIKELYKLGARKMVMFQIGPIGCLPYMIKKQKPATRCVENINDLVSTFNEKLEAMVKQLTKVLGGSQFVIARVFPLIKNMIEKPSVYGFQETRLPCCLTQKNGTGLCQDSESLLKTTSKLKVTSTIIKEQRSRNDQKLRGCRGSDFPSGAAGSCHNTEKYVFFDELHMTEAANLIISERCLAGTDGACSPYGINQLAKA